MPSKHTRGSGLRRLSDTCLLSRLDELAVRERRITLCLIEHLCEIDRRRLHLEEGYRSMFAHCTRRLGYSASAASRRIRTARCVRRSPDGANRNAGQKRSRGISIERPAPHVTAGAASTGGAGTMPADNNQPAEGSRFEKRVTVKFSAPAEIEEQIRKARILFSFRLPGGLSLADVFGAVLDDFIERHDPSYRAARRDQRSRKKHRNESTVPDAPSEAAMEAASPPDPDRSGRDQPPANPRATPASVRDAVLAGSGGRCQYVSPGGVRCGATMHLQIDHILPVASGGTAEPANLRVLCGPHNRLEAKRLLGPVADQWRRHRGGHPDGPGREPLDAPPGGG